MPLRALITMTAASAALAKVIDKQYKMAEQTMEEIYQTVKEHFVHPIQKQ